MNKSNSGYLPHETPSPIKLLLFGLQHMLVMLPATMLVAILTGFHIPTAILMGGVATLVYTFITKGKIPLNFGSSFAYIAPVVAITGTQAWSNGVAPDHLIGTAQFGILASGFVSIAAGLIIKKMGQEKLDQILPPALTGAVSLVIGASLMGSAMTDAVGDGGIHLLVAMVALLITLYFSIRRKGIVQQLSILIGLAAGYLASLATGLVTIEMIQAALAGDLIKAPHIVLPIPNWEAVLAIMPIAIATIPESTAHLYQLDVYIDALAAEKGEKPSGIRGMLGINLVADGIGDILSGMFGQPGGTNYGEAISLQAITKNYSTNVVRASAVIAIVLSFFTPLFNLLSTLPAAVVGGVSVYLFGVIAAQGIAIILNRKVDLFDAKNLAIIAIVMTVGLGGSFVFGGGIPVGGIMLPPIATASLLGILLNWLL